MSAIKGKDTSIEKKVRKFLFARGYRYRLNYNRLPGHPDIVMKKYRTVIFVNGCFWHGHEGCKYFVWPENNAEFWRKKIVANISRDERKKSQLEEMGWNVIVVWECELRPKERQETLEKLEKELYRLLKKE